MNADQKPILIIAIIGALVFYVVWILISPKPPQTQKRIREEFKNGNVIDMPVDETITRDNWDCTGDCSGHEAGYSWAEEQGITDPSDCGGNSESFIEGCETYANEQ